MIRQYIKLASLFFISSIFLLAACSASTASTAQESNEAPQTSSETKVTFEGLYVEGDARATLTNLYQRNYGKPYKNQASRKKYVDAMIQSLNYTPSNNEGEDESCLGVLSNLNPEKWETKEPNAVYQTPQDFQRDTGCSASIFNRFEKHFKYQGMNTDFRPIGPFHLFELNNNHALVVIEQYEERNHWAVEGTPWKLRDKEFVYYFDMGTCQFINSWSLYKSTMRIDFPGFWVMTSKNQIIDISIRSLSIYSKPWPKPNTCHYKSTASLNKE